MPNPPPQHWSRYVGGAAVYGIRCEPTGQVYIGRSLHVKGRWCNHRNRLRRGIHENPQLQNDWDAYGAEAFSFYILQDAPEDLTLAEREEYASHQAAGTQLYNILPCVEGGEFWSGRKHTEAAKEKQRASSLKRWRHVS